MFTRCPKCGHAPLPNDQSLPAPCPSCGVILAKVAQALKQDEEPFGPGVMPNRHSGQLIRLREPDPLSITELLLHVPQRVDAMSFWLRLALLTGFAVWGLILIGQDYRNGEIGSSFLHRPLLVFHEAGHVVFRLLGPWMMVLGGSLGQLIMPGVLAGALLLRNRDPYGASIGLWLVGVSLLDLAPYMYDALQPQLMLLSGMTGEEGGHDWIFLFSSFGLLPKAQFIGALTHKLGAMTVVTALAWGVLVLRLQHARLDGVVLHEE
jgi:hypothetical protein